MKKIFEVTQKGSAVRLPPHGSCLYCGATTYRPGEKIKLAEEHIIPEGLGGTLILPESSCEACEKITGSIEQSILKTVFYAPRIQLKVRRKRRKRQKEKFRLSAEVGGRKVMYDLPIEEHPTALVMFGLGPPGILVGHDGTDRTGQSFSFTPLSPKFNDALASGISLSLNFGNLYYFWRILAKIAHGYAVCTIGADKFEPFLLNYIREESKENFYLVGGDPKKKSTPESLHRLELNFKTIKGNKYVVVRIRLFAFLGTPTYCVVVGKVPD